jgi:hypothetical protein
MLGLHKMYWRNRTGWLIPGRASSQDGFPAVLRKKCSLSSRASANVVMQSGQHLVDEVGHAAPGHAKFHVMLLPGVG